MKILITLCEGPHDVAFLYRILLTDGFVNSKLKLSEYPKPLDEYLSKQAIGEKISERKLEDVRERLLPSDVLVRGEDELVLLYAIGGDGKKELRSQLIKDIRSMAALTDPRAFMPTSAGDKYAVFYLFDADDRGIDKRVDEIGAELSNILSVDVKLIGNGSKCTIENIDYGAYIFARPDANYGKLEDILIPLMQKGNEEVFDKAESYLSTYHEPERLKRLTIERNDKGGLVEKRKSKKGSKFDIQKSKIGVAGQLQNSGATNSVCIKHSDYLTFSKIREDKSCQEIISVFGILLS